jgi:succinate-semialdehyde dehydrogenase/glutarate-semialdehyde dehydrogenase
VRGVKFTGSTAGGKQVAAIAGAHMKQGCYELGGSDPFIVLDDSDVQFAIDKAYVSRMVNNGQACINAKRFIIHSKIYDQFRDGLI